MDKSAKGHFEGLTDKRHLIWALPLACVFAAAVFFVVLLCIEWLWKWIVPNVFPGAVAEKIVVAELGHGNAFKLLIFLLFAKYLPEFVLSGRNRRKA